jgi:hypothetical protein
MVVLRSKLSGFYFKDFGAWTPEVQDAKTFSDEWAARAFVRSENVEDVQVIDAQPAPVLRIAA